MRVARTSVTCYLAFLVGALSDSAAWSNGLTCNSFQDNNKTCVLSSWQQVSGDASLSIQGKILITSGARIKTNGKLSLIATGAVVVNQAAQLLATGSVTIEGGGQSSTLGSYWLSDSVVGIVVSEYSVIKSLKGDISCTAASLHLMTGASIDARKGNVFLGIDDGDMLFYHSTGCQEIANWNSTVYSKSASLWCDGGSISVGGGGLLSAGTGTREDTVVLRAAYVYLAEDSTITAAGLDVTAAQDANITGVISPLKHESDDNLKYSWVNVTVPNGHLTLGQGNTNPWNLYRLWVFANSISILGEQSIQTHADGCNTNPDNRPGDVCLEIMSFQASHLLGMPPISLTNVSFGTILAAQTTLVMNEGVSIHAATVLLCSLGSVTLHDTVTIDVSGRGCGPGLGQAPGESRATFVGAGAAGGSHIGRGGQGGKYGSGVIDLLTSAPAPYDWPTSSHLPTESASGGGCGVPKPCNNNAAYPALNAIQNPSAGGGLIWLSAVHMLMYGRIELKADGKPGVSVTYIPGTQLVSGAGAGGQILLYTQSFTATSSVLLSAEGGDTQCNENQVSGAGGGGFIGLLWKRGPASSSPGAEPSAFTVAMDGGDVSDDCAALIPTNGREALKGTAGLAMSLAPCALGLYGMFCVKCPRGKYNDGNRSTCTDCTNRPSSNAIYGDVDGWPNSSCPFSCSPDVPNMKVNPTCLNAWEYMIKVYGNKVWLGFILAVFLLALLFLVCRRSGLCRKILLIRSRRRIPGRPEFSFHGGSSLDEGCCRRMLRNVSMCIRSRCGKCCKHADSFDSGQENSMQDFTKERLPFHVARVFLSGNNTASNPWVLEESLPTILEPLIESSQWDAFAAELTRLSRVHRTEPYWQKSLRYVYPPFLPIYSSWRRRQRSRQLRQCTQEFSEGNDQNVAQFSTHPTIWKPIRARSKVGGAHGDLLMTFGCDSGATSAYLDFFDFSRSQFDWAPTDLKRDALVFVAHGLGSYAEPFALDVCDPVVQQVVHSGLGATNIFTVISVFNRTARLLSPSELENHGTGPVMAQLVQKVERCAAECGLDGFVKVVAMPQCKHTPDIRMVHVRAEPSSPLTSFTDLLRNTDRPLTVSWQSHTFTTMPYYASKDVDPQLNRNASSSTTIPNLVSSPTSAPTTFDTSHSQVLAGPKMETRLCLIFANFAEEDRTSQDSASTANTGMISPNTVCTLTSPLCLASLTDQLTRLSHMKQPATIPENPNTCSWRLASCLLFCRLCIWRGKLIGLHLGYASPSTVLLLLIILFFADLLVFLLNGYILLRLSPVIVVIWMLLPPFTQVLAVITGPLFVVSERPHLGRLYASATLLSTLNSVVLLFVLLTFFRGSEIFDLLELLIAGLIKLALFICANVHISNLEIAHDVSFVEADQGGFLGADFNTGGGRQERAASDFSVLDAEEQSTLNEQLTIRTSMPFLSPPGSPSLGSVGQTSAPQSFTPSPF